MSSVRHKSNYNPDIDHIASPVNLFLLINIYRTADKQSLVCQFVFLNMYEINDYKCDDLKIIFCIEFTYDKRLFVFLLDLLVTTSVNLLYRKTFFLGGRHKCCYIIFRYPYE